MNVAEAAWISETFHGDDHNVEPPEPSSEEALGQVRQNPPVVLIGSTTEDNKVSEENQFEDPHPEQGNPKDTSSEAHTEKDTNPAVKERPDTPGSAAQTQRPPSASRRQRRPSSGSSTSSNSGMKKEDRPSSGRQTTERPSSGRQTTERPSSGRQTTEIPSSGRQTTDRPSSESQTIERPSSGRQRTTERPSSGRQTTTERPSSGQQTTERPSSGQQTTTVRPSSGRQTTERPLSVNNVSDERPSSARSKDEETPSSPDSKAEERPSSGRSKTDERPLSAENKTDEKLSSGNTTDPKEAGSFVQKETGERPSSGRQGDEKLSSATEEQHDERPTSETRPSSAQKEVNQTYQEQEPNASVLPTGNEMEGPQLGVVNGGGSPTTPDNATNTDKEEQPNNVTQTGENNDRAGEKGTKARRVVVSDPEVVVQNVLKQLARLKEMETHDNTEAQTAMKAIGRAYWNHRACRKQVCAALLKEGYAGLTVDMLVYYNKVGIFKNDEVWFPAYYTLNNAWNYSDNSKDLAKELAEKGMLSLMVANITHKPYLDNMGSKNVSYVIKSSLSILQNMSKVPELKSVYLEHNAIEALKLFTESSNDFFKAVSMMVLTTLTDEKDNALLEDTGVIPFMVQCIRKALDNKKNRRHRGFTPAELTECLFRMAANDNNKLKIVHEGALPLFVAMLNYSDVEENHSAAQCLWTLAFDPQVAQLISEEPGCVDALKVHTTNEILRVRKAAKGTLWKLENEDAHKKELGEREGEVNVPHEYHIMLSYNWDHQETIVKLADRLKAEGYRVWLDIEAMGGSTLEAMASAVENAAVVLVAMSDKYKISPNCRTEAEYTFQLKKPIIPLLMQRKYRPDGWLGMLAGAKLYINFDGKYTFDKAFAMLEKELKGRGRDVTVVPAMSIQPVVSQPTTAAVGGPFAERPVSSAQPSNALRSWTKDDVHAWLEEHHLEHCKESFVDIDGRLLSSLLTLRLEAPEYFFSSLERKFGLTMIDVLRLVDGMVSLPR